MKFKSTILKTGYAKRYFLFLFVVSGMATAQLNTENLVQMTEKDGLSSETINRVIVDHKGYVWIGTPNGLSRYDGYGFKQFFSNPTDSTAIQGMLIYALMEGSQNRVWVGTNPNFLEVFDPITKSFRSYEYNIVIDPLFGKNPLYGYTINSIVEDAKNRLFFDVHSNEDESWLLYLDPVDDQIKIFKGPDGKPFRDTYKIKKDTSGQIWLLSGTGMYYIDEKDQLQAFHLLDEVLYARSEYPTDLVFTKDDHLFVVTTNATLIDLDRATGTHELWGNETHKKNIDRSFCVMTPDRSENMWIGTNAGIFYYDRKSQKFSTFNKGENKEFEKVNVSSLAMDDFGNLWIGTANKGLLRYEKRPDFISLKSKSPIKNTLAGWVGQIGEISNGKIWLRTNNAINILDMTQKEIQLFPNHLLPENFYVSTFWENENDIYLSSFGGSKLQYNQKEDATEKIAVHDLPENLIIRAFKKDTKGNEWYGTDKGLYRKEKNKQAYKHYDLLGLPGTDNRNNNINGILESQKNGLWLLTDNGLFLYRYDTDTVERHAFQDYAGDPLITQDVNALYEDPDGILWVGLWQGGLVKYDLKTKTIKNYKQEDGLPSMSVQGILGDENKGNLWLSTFNGLSRFDKKAEIFNNYSVMDGIQGSQFSDGAYLKTSEGLFIFGGSNGITFFNPSDIDVNNDPPKVFLTDLKLFNKSVLPGEDSVLKKPIDQTEQIALNHDQNSLSIQFVGLHYANPLKNEYAYQLENYDETWRTVGGQNEAFYPNLSPGHYVFKVKAANDKGVWTEEPITLGITINPPWWRTGWAYMLYSILLVLLGFMIHKFMKNRTIRIEREKSKDRELKQAKEIEKAYAELKSTQAQLIQSEKMASLGELTAGIAHEIQNPLNFVNNFAEVSTELIDEVEEERQKKHEERDEELVTSNLVDLKENLKKINHHGKRAGEIVKGMLQHSRAGSGEKELTDINALADEYFRLAYHGLRAKDKSFNAHMTSDFDPDLPKMDVVPQDMGRVLLNLITNAFFAVNEKSKEGIEGYEPTVSVNTKKVANKVQLTVKDNGNGIPEAIKEKIFQPFFTTKPTGSGTGLGLSLSYDIVKAHGGELKVETKEGEGTEFIVLLPEIKISG